MCSTCLLSSHVSPHFGFKVTVHGHLRCSLWATTVSPSSLSASVVECRHGLALINEVYKTQQNTK